MRELITYLLKPVPISQEDIEKSLLKKQCKQVLLIVNFLRLSGLAYSFKFYEKEYLKEVLK